MRTIVLLIVGLSLLILGADISRTLFTDEEPDAALTTLMEVPPPAITTAKANGYLFLLGFAVDPSFDPAQTGHEMWLEVQSDPGQRFFDYNKEKRSDLRVAGDEEATVQALKAWTEPDPIPQFQKLRDPVIPPKAPLRVLVDRYSQWLTLAFEDWGFGHPATPRFAEPFLAHRLYLAEGFSQGMAKGVNRLVQDLSAWRTVFAKARTLPTKTAAACIIDDDVRLLSLLLGRYELDNTVLGQLGVLAEPLDKAERSFRWPIQNRFAIEVGRFQKPFAQAIRVGQAESDQAKRWLAATAGLRADVFNEVEHRLPDSPFAKAFIRKQKLLNTYAQYYAALIKAAENPNTPLPNLHDFAKASAGTLIEHVLHPISNVLTGTSEPAWEPLIVRFQETDARFRLAVLQARVRRPPLTEEILARIAEAGEGLFDPFSGIPMLWSPTQRKLYSVGKDRLDDGGDGTLDISVSVYTPPSRPSPPPAQRGTRGKKQVRPS